MGPAPKSSHSPDAPSSPVPLSLSLPRFFVSFCDYHRTTPAELLQGFIADLCDLPGNHGSDERSLALRYFQRCGYPFRRENFGDGE